MFKKFLAALSIAAACLPAFAQEQPLKVSIGVGGKYQYEHLPINVAESLGYFKDEGLDVTFYEISGGKRVVEAIVGGTVDIGAIYYEHTLRLNNKGMKVKAFVNESSMMLTTLAYNKKTLPNYKSPADLKGKIIGFQTPGGGTEMAVRHALAQYGLKKNDIRIVAVNSYAGIYNALRRGEVDAVLLQDPMYELLLKMDSPVGIVFDFHDKATDKKFFNASMPTASLMAFSSYIDKNPEVIQRVTNAIVRAQRWIETASAIDLMRVVPERYMFKDKVLYVEAFEKNRLAVTRSKGYFPATSAATVSTVLSAFDPEANFGGIKQEDTFTNEFVKRANAKWDAQSRSAGQAKVGTDKKS